MDAQRRRLSCQGSDTRERHRHVQRSILLAIACWQPARLVSSGGFSRNRKKDKRVSAQERRRWQRLSFCQAAERRVSWARKWRLGHYHRERSSRPRYKAAAVRWSSLCSLETYWISAMPIRPAFLVLPYREVI